MAGGTLGTDNSVPSPGAGDGGGALGAAGRGDVHPCRSDNNYLSGQDSRFPPTGRRLSAQHRGVCGTGIGPRRTVIPDA
jgi:hypothetical protein